MDDGETKSAVSERSTPRERLHRVFVNPRERRLRAPWRLLAGLFTFSLLAFGVALGASLLPPPGAFDGRFLPALYALLLSQLDMVTLVVGLAVASRQFDHRSLTDLGLGIDTQWWRDGAFGLVLGMVLPTVVFLLEWGAGWVEITGTLAVGAGSVVSFVPGTPAPFALVLVALFFAGVSLFEEFLVRGYLLTNLAEGFNGLWRFDYRTAIWIATLSTALLFGVLHAANPNATPLSVLNISLYGVLLGLGYALTDRLAIPLGLHLTWNLFVGSVFGFPVSGVPTGTTVLATRATGPSLLTGGSFGPEGGLVALVALVLGLALLAWWIRREYGRLALRESVAVPTLRP